MKLYVRQLAWLEAVPKPREGSSRAKTGKEQTETRLDRMKRDGMPVPLPPNPAPHIVRRLIEIGLTGSSGMGEVPLSWREINEWQAATGVSLSAFEAKLIRELSVSYIAQKAKSGSENSPPPWAPRNDR